MRDERFEKPRDLTADEEAMLQKQKADMTEFKKNKLEIEARRNWNNFYKRNGCNFFKDRHWSKNEFQEIFDDIDLKEELVFLEVGCGVGNMLFPLTEYFPHWRFFGFDFSTQAISQLENRARMDDVDVTAKVLDITAEDHSSLYFPLADLATFIFVLSSIHPDKHDQTVRNLANFIRPNKSVFFRDYGALDHAMIRFGRGTKISDRFYARQDGTRAFYFYLEEIKDLFERNGFVADKCEYLYKKTTNFQKELSVDRVFVQDFWVEMNHLIQTETSNDTDPDGPSTSWLFTLDRIESTPSRRAKISEKDENKKRRESIKMIRDIGTEMKLSMRGTIATANVYFHRFYMQHSMVEYPPRLAVLGCLFLAGKVEETPKKCKDLFSVAQAKYPEIYSKDSFNDVMNIEKILLHTLRFDLQVEHPYQYLLEYFKVFQMEANEKTQVSTLAWTFINDSFSTMLCLMWEPEIIAIALLQMAINLSLENKTLSELKYNNQFEYKNWWNHFVNNLHSNTIEIIEQILQNFYTDCASDTPQGSAS